MTVNSNKAKDIFVALVGKVSPDQWDQQLQLACEGDDEVRDRVLALLRAHAEPGSFLAQPAIVAGTHGHESPITELMGASIGPYKLLQQIGEGGMGTVFMAEQTDPVRRKVALKIIKPGMDSRQVIARFEAERQALAIMDHVNICRVLDAGATGPESGCPGRPYFVMELVHGVPITKYCDDNHLTPRERLELFVPVCQAIQHAHQKGIIHRDIKPSNVMITLYDGKPVPKVIDFGVAKAIERQLTDRTLFTQYGTLVGTLEYMSPEQAEMSALGADTRSDIFSLGVLLYELLTGSTPLSHNRLMKAAHGEIIRMIKEEEAPKPSTRLSDSGEALESIAAQRNMESTRLTKLVRGELDWIAMKCLEKDRNRRYETASSLATDVQRYLHDEPVQACPPSRWYRFRKFARRNNAALMTATAVVLATLLTLAGLAINIRLVTREKIQKEHALAQAIHEKERADQNLVRARKAVKNYLTLAANNQLLKEANFQELRRDLLQSTIPFYEEFVEQERDDLELESERGRAYGDLALVREELGDLDEALMSHEKRRDIFDRLVASSPANPVYRHELANSFRNLGNVHLDLNQHDEAEPAFRQAVTILTALTSQYPFEAAYRQDLAGAYSNLSVLLRGLGKLSEALDDQQKATALRERLVIDSPSVADFRRDLAASLVNLSSVLFNLDRHDEALASIQRAVDLFAKLAEEHPRSPQNQEMWGGSLDNQSVMLCELGRHDEGLIVLQQAVHIIETLAADFPSVPGYRHGLAISLMNLSILQAELGRNEDGLATSDKALGIFEELVSKSPEIGAYQQGLALTYNSQCQLYRKMDRNDDALSALRKGLNLQEQLVADHPDVPRFREELARVHSAMGEILVILGRYDDANAALDEALPIREELARRSSSTESEVNLAATYGTIGNLHLEQGASAVALQWFDRALARLTRVLEAEPRLAVARNYASKMFLSRSTALGELSRYPESLKDLDQALAFDNGEDRLAIRVQRAKMMAHLQMHAQAIRETKVVADLPDLPVELIHGIACVYAICSRQVPEDPQLSERYAVRAVAMLRRAWEQDPNVIKEVSTDPNLDHLRSREDFQQLMNRMKEEPL